MISHQGHRSQTLVGSTAVIKSWTVIHVDKDLEKLDPSQRLVKWCSPVENSLAALPKAAHARSITM